MAHSKMAPRRKVNVQGQPHSLAYINKDEARMLRRMGGSGKPGPSGIPTYIGDNWGGGYSSEGGSNTDRGVSDTSKDENNRDGSFGGNNGNENNSVNPAERSKADVARAAEKAKADAANKTRTTARAEVQARIDRLSAYSEKKDTNFINKYAAKANVAGASRVASKLAEEGAIAIRDKSGQVVGVMHDGPFGLGKVYSGRMLDKADYTGPAEFANNVTRDGGGGSSDDNIRGGAKPKEEVVESIDGEVNLPDAPDSGDGGDATDDAKRRSKMGKESTISTTSQGLLGSAKTRNRSLMSGLIS